ncbi:MAG: nucleotide exchange factor GrpE [Aeromicrobium sp.]
MTEPETGSVPEDEVTEPAEETQQAPAPAEPTVEEQLAERTLDLQRLQAEYVNYKRRVDRDRELVRAQGEANVLQSLMTVLDDIRRAADHGELEGGFKAVADALHQAVAKHKLESFGDKGEPFDPSLHEAVFHAGESADVDTTTVHSVMRTGYRVGDRVLRAATVGVVDPAAAVAPEESEPVDSADTGDTEDK